MTVSVNGEAIRLEGGIGVEDAETLTALLQAQPDLPVDLSGCRALHTAAAQALLAFGARLTGRSPDPFIGTLLAPALISAGVLATRDRAFPEA